MVESAITPARHPTRFITTHTMVTEREERVQAKLRTKAKFGQRTHPSKVESLDEGPPVLGDVMLDIMVDEGFTLGPVGDLLSLAGLHLELIKLFRVGEKRKRKGGKFKTEPIN